VSRSFLPLCLLILITACNHPASNMHFVPVAGTQPYDATRPAVYDWQSPGMKEPYRIQTGDALDVRFLYESDYNDSVRVRPDGRISMSPVDDVPAAGLTPEELDKQLTDKFAKVIRRPDLSVIVREFAAQRAFVGGEVQQPGVVELVSADSVLSAIMQTGGALPGAELNRVLLIRRGGGNQCCVIPLNVNKIIKQGTGDLLLHPFDVVYVPRNVITEINLFVEQYINRIVPRMFGFQFLYNLNPEVQVASDEGTNLLFQRPRIR